MIWIPDLPFVPYIFGTCCSQAFANISGNETRPPGSKYIGNERKMIWMAWKMFEKLLPCTLGVSSRFLQMGWHGGPQQKWPYNWVTRVLTPIPHEHIPRRLMVGRCFSPFGMAVYPRKSTIFVEVRGNEFQYFLIGDGLSSFKRKLTILTKMVVAFQGY